jgi:hypothetical protein
VNQEHVANWLDEQIGEAEALFHSSVDNGELVIEADRNGLLRLARDLLSLAQSAYRPYVHQHFDAGNFSEPDATPLTIYRIERADRKQADPGSSPG